jgi:hypothetical protein
VCEELLDCDGGAGAAGVRAGDLIYTLRRPCIQAGRPTTRIDKDRRSGGPTRVRGLRSAICRVLLDAP